MMHIKLSNIKIIIVLIIQNLTKHSFNEFSKVLLDSVFVHQKENFTALGITIYF